MITKEFALSIDKRINRDYWFNLQQIKSCFICKFKEPLYIESKEIKGAKLLNDKLMAHLKMSHGLTPDILIDEIAKKLYKNEEDKKKMIELYKFYDN